MGRVDLTTMESVIYGEPAATALRAEAERLGAERVFVLSSGTLNRETDEVKKLRESLGSRFAGVYDQITAHVPRTDVVAAVLAAREVQADLIVTIGGGSPTDAAKAVALCLANDVRQVADIDALTAPNATPKPPTIAQISIPTTLSAGEFSSIAGVTNEATATKEMMRHPALMPRVVILDPKAASHTPEWLFLSTGVRAIDHCVEGICSLESNPYGDAQALRGLSLLANGMTAVKDDPNNEAARLNCLIGGWLSMAPLASGVPMGASHGIGYILGAKHGIPHGHTSCLMLPAVMQWNASVNSDKQQMVANALGDGQQGASQLLDELITQLGQPRGLNAAGISHDDFDTIAEAALRTPWVPRNPRKIFGASEVREILELAA